VRSGAVFLDTNGNEKLFNIWLYFVVLAGLVGTTLKPSTLRAMKSHLRTHILPSIGELPLTACTVKNVQAFISSLAVAGLTRKTIENIVGSLQSMLGTAGKSGYVPSVFERG
jgi:hypothetical protein